MSEDTAFQVDNLLFGLVQIKYPSLSFLNVDRTIPLLGRLNFSSSRIFFRFLFYMGLASSAYYFLRGSFSLSRFILTYFKSIFNAKKYLNPSYDSNQRYYAVIYGTDNRAGVAFAHFLASKGYNLILIGRDATPINDIEISIKQLLKKN